MPATSRGEHVEVQGLRELRRDLRGIDRTLPTRLNRAIKLAAAPVLADAKRLAPRSSINRAGYKHVADTLKIGTRGSKVVIYSRRSGAGIIHYGGRHPLFGNRDRWYQQKPTLFLLKASARNAPRIEQDVARTVESLMRSAGFHD